ncbi:MAG: VOC family protein [Acidimicrobiales bacterium]|nr:VOC family protein [Acidimicrobiales bacterium]
MTDKGFTHVALTVRDVGRSVDFYERYAAMTVVHERTDPETGQSVVWLSDLTRPFVIVLVETDEPSPPLSGVNHLGVGVESRNDVDRLAAAAREEGLVVVGPHDYGEPVGYWAFIIDPDGHTLELSHGQEVGLTVENRRRDKQGPFT